MTPPKILYFCHNHPDVRPGGAEAYAYELYKGIQRDGEFLPYFVAKGGPPMSKDGQRHPGTFVGRINEDPNQYFAFTDGYEYDWINSTITGKDFYTRHVHELLRAIRPDIVHFQHTFFLGYDMVRQVRRTLGDTVPILYTLHEYLPICHRQGQMLRTDQAGGGRCINASSQRCHECFPEISAQAFFLRKRLIQSHLSLVDQFIAPSRFLMERFIDWGIPSHRIVCEEYGRLPVTPLPDPAPPVVRNRFAFFGQLNPYKGADVLLRAMQIIQREADCTPQVPRLKIHGANLDLQHSAFKEALAVLLEQTRDLVDMVGKYCHQDLPRLMAEIDWVIVPSIWWENSPLVIQEAFAYGRPVICSDIGGMAEKVTDELNGLHFRVGDPVSLARVIVRAATEPGLWERLRSAGPAIHPMKRHIKFLSQLYRTLLQRKAA